MRRRSRDAGFTLVEIIVTVTIGVVIFSGALAIYHFANRSRGVTAGARGLQTALLIQEQLCDDLGKLISISGSPVRVWPDKPARLSFYAYDTATTLPDGRLPINAVLYTLDATPAKPGMLKRIVGTQEQSVGVSPLASATFQPFLSPTGVLIRVTLRVGREAGDPPGPPAVHTFLVRLPSPHMHPALHPKIITAFAHQKEDAPRNDKLPPP